MVGMRIVPIARVSRELGAPWIAASQTALTLPPLRGGRVRVGESSPRARNSGSAPLSIRRERLAPAEAGLEVDLLVEGSGRVGSGAGAAGDREVAGAGITSDRLLDDID